MNLTELSKKGWKEYENLSIVKNGEAKAVRIRSKTLGCQPLDILAYKGVEDN